MAISTGWYSFDTSAEMQNTFYKHGTCTIFSANNVYTFHTITMFYKFNT